MTVAMKGPRMIIATTTDRGTDEDCETAGRVARAMTDNFLRRPFVDEKPIFTLATMANNDLCMMSLNDERPPLCDAAFIFVDRNRARFLISGSSAAYHFEGGKLAHRSDPTDADIIGSGPRYRPRIEPDFELEQTENAFLAASASLAKAVSDEALEESLRASSTPEEWMERLKELVGPDVQFCAITVFPPMAKHSRLKGLFTRS